MTRLYSPAPPRRAAGRPAATLALAALLLAPAFAPAQREVASFPIGKNTSVRVGRVAISPDSRFVAGLFRGDGNEEEKKDNIRIWDLRAKKRILIFETGFGGGLYPGALFAYTPDGKRIVCSTNTGLYVFDAKSGEQLKAFETRLSASVAALAPDGRSAVCAAGDLLAGYDLKTGKELFAVTTEVVEANQIALSPDGKLAAVAGVAGGVHLIGLKARKELGALPRDERESYTRLAFSPDSRRLAVCVTPCRYAIYDVKSRRRTHQGEFHREGVGALQGLAFTPDGKRVVGVGTGHKKAVHVWEWQTGKLTGGAPDLQRGNCGMALSADGKTVVTGSREVKVYTLVEDKKAKP